MKVGMVRDEEGAIHVWPEVWSCKVWWCGGGLCGGVRG